MQPQQACLKALHLGRCMATSTPLVLLLGLERLAALAATLEPVQLGGRHGSLQVSRATLLAAWLFAATAAASAAAAARLAAEAVPCKQPASPVASCSAAAVHLALLLLVLGGFACRQ